MDPALEITTKLQKKKKEGIHDIWHRTSIIHHFVWDNKEKARVCQILFGKTARVGETCQVKV